MAKRHYYAIRWTHSPWAYETSQYGSITYLGTAIRFNSAAERDRYVDRNPYATTATRSEAIKAVDAEDYATGHTAGDIDLLARYWDAR